MKIGPKYKIARRLGAPIFEKTQTPKYALSLSRKERSGGKDQKRGMRGKSEFGRELNEKQKARFTYGIVERQFKNYVEKALLSQHPVEKLFKILESRLDNVLYRSGLAKTRIGGRQMGSHGHILINNRRVTIPSIQLSIGDIIQVRTGSATSPLFTGVPDRLKEITIPEWLKVDEGGQKVEVVGEPVYKPEQNVFDLRVVVEFYSR